MSWYISESIFIKKCQWLMTCFTSTKNTFLLFLSLQMLLPVFHEHVLFSKRYPFFIIKNTECCATFVEYALTEKTVSDGKRENSWACSRPLLCLNMEYCPVFENSKGFLVSFFFFIKTCHFWPILNAAQDALNGENRKNWWLTKQIKQRKLRKLTFTIQYFQLIFLSSFIN